MRKAIILKKSRPIAEFVMKLIGFNLDEILNVAIPYRFYMKSVLRQQPKQSIDRLT